MRLDLRRKRMARISPLRLAAGVVLCVLLPGAAPAQRIDALRQGVSTVMRQQNTEASRGDVMLVQGSPGPSLSQHSLYGALAGAAVWGIYFALPCDSGCRTESARGERLILLPMAVATGTVVGLATGLIRRAR
jgi:hypothetical protein